MEQKCDALWEAVLELQAHLDSWKIVAADSPRYRSVSAAFARIRTAAVRHELVNLPMELTGADVEAALRRLRAALPGDQFILLVNRIAEEEAGRAP